MTIHIKKCDHCGVEIEPKIRAHKLLSKCRFDFCDECRELYEDEKNKFEVYQKAFNDWTQEFTRNAIFDDCCEKECEPFADNGNFVAPPPIYYNEQGEVPTNDRITRRN